MARLPDDVWVLLADWSAHPGLALLDRRRRALLRRRIVVARLSHGGEAAQLDAYLGADGPGEVVDVQLALSLPLLWEGRAPRLPPTVRRLALRLGSAPGLEHGGVPAAAAWVVRWSGLRALTLSVAPPRPAALGNAEFVALWEALVCEGDGLPCLETLALGLAGHGIDDAVLYLLGPEGVRRRRRAGLRDVCLDLGANRLGAPGVVGLCAVVLDGSLPPLARCRLRVAQNAGLAGPAGGAALGRCLAAAAAGVRAEMALDARHNRLGLDGLAALVDAAAAQLRAPAPWRRLELDFRSVGARRGLTGQVMRRWVRLAAPEVRWLDLWVGGPEPEATRSG